MTMASLTFFLASTLLWAGVGSKSTAFLSPRPRPIIRTNENRVGALAENGEGGIDLDTFLSSLPSTGDVKENVLEVRGTYGIHGDEDPSLHDHILAKVDASRRILQVGERGEQYVVAQFSLFLFIAIGGLPLVGDAVLSIFGPTLIILGLFMVYRSAVDLDNNLSPWPVPTQSGRGSLVDGGIYSYIRHPMYAGSLLGMAGLGLITDSATRLFLTVLLYFVLDAKSDYEETKLMEKFGSEYEVYKLKVQGKFCPPNMKSIFESNTRT